MLRAVWTKNSGEKLRTCCTKQSVAMTSLLSPHCLLASYPSCYHLLQYNHADILFLISKLSLNQIRLETANSRHTPQHNTLGILSSCPPWISKLKKKIKMKNYWFFYRCMLFFLHPGATSWLVTLSTWQILNPKGFSKALGPPFPLERGGYLSSSGYLHVKGGAWGHDNPFQLSDNWTVTP